MNTNYLEVTIPVYNEERRLRNGVVTLKKFCEEKQLSVSIVIADNGSTDRTVEIGKQLSRELRDVSVISVPMKGVGAALKCSWTQSRATVVGYMDVDLSTDIQHLVEVFDLMKAGKTRVISGSRLLPGAKVTGRKLSREIASRAFNQLLQFSLGCRFTDGMCGFKFLTRESFQLLSERGLKNNEWFFNTELLIKAEWAGIPVHEIPVHWSDDHDSKVKILELAVKYSKEVARLRKEQKAA